MESYEPEASNNSFVGLISKHQTDYFSIVNYTANDEYYINYEIFNRSKLFILDSQWCSAFSALTHNKVILEFNFSKTLLLTHYQLQQRSDNSNSGHFKHWLLDAKSGNLNWMRIDEKYEENYEQNDYIGLYEPKNILVNKLRFTFLQNHICLKQIEFYGSYGSFRGYDYVYMCRTIYCRPPWFPSIMSIAVMIIINE